MRNTPEKPSMPRRPGGFISSLSGREAMNEGTETANFSRNAVPILVAFGLASAALLATGAKDYPGLHTILDTGMLLLSAVLALLFWDMGTRLNLRLKKWIAVSFAVTALAEFVHAMVNVEWSGPLAFIAQMENT